MADSSTDMSNTNNLATKAAIGEEHLHDVFQVPTRSLSWGFRLLFGLASILTGLCNVTIKQLLLPAQVGFLVPDNKFTAFAVVASIGALAGVIIAPLSGAMSDRTTIRWGRRRPWIALGLLFGIVGLIVMARATNLFVLLIGEVVVQLSVDAVLSVVTAVIPDAVPPHQRATASAFIGMSPIVGGLVGLLLVARFVNATLHPQQGYYVLAIASAVCVLPFILILKEKPLPKGVVPPLNMRALFSVFWVNPKKYPDFGFTWLSRSLIFLGYTILISYLFYYLQSVIHYPAPDKGVAIFQLVSTCILILAAIGGGILADRVQRLKPFIVGGAILMALALLMIAFLAQWRFMIVAGIILGVGFGIYLAVDIALAVRVLPKATDRGKDLGIINTAIFIPLILSPLIGAVILNNFHSYVALFIVAAICFVLAALFILPIKGVR